jgi:hypothetical protein
MFISNHIKIRPMKFKLMIALAATLSFTACKDDKDEDNTLPVLPAEADR